mgnify:CR=1 FL=1
MTAKEFLEITYEKNKQEWKDDIFPPPTNAQEGLDILIKHFLGDDWYCISTNNEQANTEAIYEILQKYPRKKIIGTIIKKFWRKYGKKKETS